MDRNNKGQFTEGNNPWNKGTKGLCIGGVVTQFKKGHLPHNTKYNGCIVERLDKSGLTYKYIRTDLGKWELLHRYNWEQRNRPLPKNNILRSINGDTLNCDPSNWQLITRAEHLRLNNKNNTTNLIALNKKKHDNPLSLDKERAGVRLNNNNNNNYKLKNMSILKQLSQAISSLIDQLDELYLKLKAYELQVADLKNEIITLTSKASITSINNNPPARLKEEIKPTLKEKDNDINIYEQLYDQQKKHEKTCAICGKVFQPSRTNIKYCQTECAYKAKLLKTNESRSRTKIYSNKTCIVCGNEFQTSHSAKTICSDDCKQKRQVYRKAKFLNSCKQTEKTIFNKTCIVCGKEFQTTNKRKICCSTQCSKIQISPNPLKQYICLTCGKEFSSTYEKAKFCSAECRKKYHIKDWRKHYTPRISTYTCILCGKQYQSKSSSKFCIDCRKQKNKSAKLEKPITATKQECAHCGAVFAQKNINDKYCSSYCADESFWLQKLKSKPQKTNINTYTLLCQTCGAFFDSANQHHTNCPSCHKLTPQQRKAKYTEVEHLCNYKLFANDTRNQTLVNQHS